MCALLVVLLTGTAQASDPQQCTIPYPDIDPISGVYNLLGLSVAESGIHDFRECPVIFEKYAPHDIGGQLDDANFSNLDLRGTRFRLANLRRAKFVGTNLTSASFGFVGWPGYTPDRLPSGNWDWNHSITPRCETLLADGTIPAGHIGLCILPSWTWQRFIDDGAWLTPLDGADFSQAAMRKVMLSQVVAPGTTFPDLMGVQIEDSDLSRSIFGTDTKVVYWHIGDESSDSSFPSSVRLLCGNTSAVVVGALRICARLNPNLQLDEILLTITETAKSNGLSAKDARRVADDFFRSADLSGVDLSGSDIGGVDFTGASAGQVASSSKIFAAAVSKKGTKFRNANLHGATLTGVKFRAADLRGIRSGKIRGRAKSLPSGWKIIGGYLVGHYANLAGAKLNNGDFRSADLRGTNLQGAQLGHARLSGARSGGITGKPKSLPRGWRLVKGYLRKR